VSNLITHIDQLNQEITFQFPPQRIISLVPSQTELLSDLNLDAEVIGITKFCVHPHHWHKNKRIVGGTKNYWFDVIDELKPDLIIGNKEENEQEGIFQLKQKYPVWMSDIVTWEDSLSMIKSVGTITNRTVEADRIINQIQHSFSSLKQHNKKSVLYLIWKKPWMGVGNNTFINVMLEKIGLQNCLQKASRYPELNEDEIRLLKPDLIFLSSEPYPFKEKHIEELKKLCPQATVMLVDGEMFSWYGSRLIKAASYFNSLITP
jgi:ABC-type Fe3+-hydroxamate transport system substrate-binding protein